MDANGNYVPNNQAIDSSLNSGQQSTFSSLPSVDASDPTGLAAAKSLAAQKMADITAQQQTDQAASTTATTGANDLTTQALSNYQTAGVNDAETTVNQAFQAANDAQIALETNMQKIQAGQSQGGYMTTAESQTENAQDSYKLQVAALSTSLNLQVAQQKLSVQQDFYNSLNTASSQQATNVIQATAQKLGIDATDLSTYSAIYQQATQEMNGDQQAGAALTTQLLTNIPGGWESLTPAEQNAISNLGTMPPTAAAKLAKNATLQSKQLQISQQQANTQSGIAQSQEISSLITNAQQLGIDTSSPQFQSLVTSMMGSIGNSGYSTPSSTLNVGGGSLVSSNPNPSAVVNGYDLTSYASGNAVGGPASQAANVANTVQQIGGVGSITNSQQATSSIQSIQPNSPITGDMVMAASQATGVDPAMLIGVMNAETSLGTNGKGAQQNNFGNVENTDSLMASGGSKAYPTPEAGVMAVAQNLANRRMPNQGTGQNQSANGLPVNDPSFLRNVTTTNTDGTGTKYIDLSNTSDPTHAAQINYINNWNQQNPQNQIFPVTNATELKSLQSIGQARDALTSMTQLAKQPGTFSNAVSIFGEIGQNLKQLEKGQGSSGQLQRQWTANASNVDQLFKTITETPRVNPNAFDQLNNMPSTTHSSPADALAWINTQLAALNSAEKAITGNASSNMPTTAQGVMLQGNAQGTGQFINMTPTNANTLQ
jgi:hypothetical protein